MFDTQNQQNQGIFTVTSLDLNFKKNKKRNISSQLFSTSDRNNKVTTPTPEGVKTDRSALLQRKKNYSNAIRQRNLNLLTKKKLELGTQCLTNGQSRALYQIKQNTESLLRKHRYNSKKINQNAILMLSQKKSSFSSMSVIEFDPIPFVDEINDERVEENQNNTFLFSPQIKQYEKSQKSQDQDFKVMKSENLTLCSNIFHEKVVILDSDATILAKQNATFKKDLANFKKQNSQLRKQLKDAENNIKQLQQRAKCILESSLLHSPRISCQLPQSQINNGDNSTEIIQKLRQEITQLRNLNSGLELRTYMAEKKVFEEVSQCKKKMAKQLGEWREKCTKLRAQNLKFKSCRDMTIEMEISKDQQ